IRDVSKPSAWPKLNMIRGLRFFIGGPLTRLCSTLLGQPGHQARCLIRGFASPPHGGFAFSREGGPCVRATRSSTIVPPDSIVYKLLIRVMYMSMASAADGAVERSGVTR